MKNLRRDEVIGLVGGALTLIIALIAFAIPQGGLTVSLVIIFVALVFWLAYLANENRRCIIARNFKEYCVKCKKMLNKSVRHGSIMTIQTPIREIPADAKDAFQSYMDRTFELLISTECDYKRLVVLEAGDTRPENRIKTFIEELITRAKEREHSHRGATFGLHNVQVGFVTPDSVQHSIYSNLDIHCTTDRDFSIAFMGKEAQQGIHFGSSLHLHDSKTTLSKLIRAGFQKVWDRAIGSGAIITIGESYPNHDGTASKAKSDADRDKIIAEIKTKIDTVVATLRNRPCPCSDCAEPPAFLTRISATNPAWLVAFKQLLMQ